MASTGCSFCNTSGVMKSPLSPAMANARVNRAVATADAPIDVRWPLRRLGAEYEMCWTFHVDGMFGATPELLVRREKGLVTSRVLAGTIRRTGDDEHDPEGHTIAWERQQTAALLRSARARLAELDLAIRRIEAGDHGRCEICGSPIGDERLDALPTARTCVDCAS